MKRTIVLSGLLVLVGAASLVAESVTVISAAPVYLQPTSREPLTTIAAQTVVRVVEEPKDGWVRVEFRDQRFGSRIGFVKTDHIDGAAPASAPQATRATVPTAFATEPSTPVPAATPAPASVPPSVAPAASAPSRVTAGARVFIEPTENGMHTALAGAFRKKNVPVVLVTRPDAADFVIRVTGEHKRAGWARTLMAGGYARGDSAASMTVEHRESATITYGYNVEKGGAWKGIQSAAEACAKHLKNHIDGKE